MYSSVSTSMWSSSFWSGCSSSTVMTASAGVANRGWFLHCTNGQEQRTMCF
uniref:Uncharacterized protein n=1 Tax=Arundo donax TaxID=35708 RepID=A0A0A9H5D2_ARUDO